MEENLSQKFKRDPRTILPWLIDIASGKAKVGDIPALLDDALHMKVGDLTADMSDASTAVAKAFTDIARTNPALHSVLLATTPAYAPLYNVARIKMAATKLPAGRGETLTAKEVAEITGQTFANALFPLNPASQALTQPSSMAGVVDMGQYGSEQAAHLAADFENWADYASQILTTVRDIGNQLQSFMKYLDEDIWPSIEMMRDLVLTPYLDAVKDSKAAMDDLIRHYEQAGQSADSSVPAIVGPNFDFRQYQRLALGYSLPITGAINAGMTNALLMQKYQAQQKRGFADDLSMLQAAMGAPGPSLITPLQQLAGSARPPAWFMSK